MHRIALRLGGMASALVLALVFAVVAALPARTPVASAQVPECLTGTWTLADNRAFAGNLNTILSSFGTGIDVGEVTGDVSMTIAPDGSYELWYNRFAMTLGGGFFSGSVMFDGSVRGVLRETEPGMLAGSITESNVSITFSILGTATSTTFDLPTGEGEPQAYTCDATTMNVAIRIPGSASVQVAFTRTP